MDRIRFLVRFEWRFLDESIGMVVKLKKWKIKRYDREKQTQMFIQKLQLLVSMGPPGGGRNVITDRLLTKFNVINMTFPAEKQIVRIYGSMLHHHIGEFHSEVKGIGRWANWEKERNVENGRGLILYGPFSLRFSQWNNACYHRFVHECDQQNVANPCKNALSVQSKGHIEGRSLLRFYILFLYIYIRTSFDGFNRFSKASFEVTRTTNSRGKPSYVCGCTRCSASSAIDWSTTSKPINGDSGEGIFCAKIFISIFQRQGLVRGPNRGTTWKILWNNFRHRLSGEEKSVVR